MYILKCIKVLSHWDDIKWISETNTFPKCDHIALHTE